MRAAARPRLRSPSRYANWTARSSRLRRRSPRRWRNLAAGPPDSVQKFREAAELADRHYRTGAVQIATYVELQNSYLDAVEALLDTQRETLEAGLKIQQLTGLDLNPVEIAP
jgi:cobalt-zinc-cadmium efflux system outer membrane protein